MTDPVDDIAAYNKKDLETSIEPKNNLVEHARRELEGIGEEPDVIESYLKVIQAFADMQHSGSSAYMAIGVIYDLLQFKNISTLTDDPDDWLHHTEEIWGAPGGIWQSRRNPEAFSEDGGKTYTLLSDGKGDNTNTKPVYTSEHKEAK